MPASPFAMLGKLYDHAIKRKTVLRKKRRDEWRKRATRAWYVRLSVTCTLENYYLIADIPPNMSSQLDSHLFRKLPLENRQTIYAGVLGGGDLRFHVDESTSYDRDEIGKEDEPLRSRARRHEAS